MAHIFFPLFCIVFALTFSTIFSAAPIRIACIGDSITQGGACVPESYTDLLAAQFGDGYEVINYGIGGRTMLKLGTLDGVQPFSYWDTDAWKSALASKANIVTIMLGTNDAKYYNWDFVQQSKGDFYTLDYVNMIQDLIAAHLSEDKTSSRGSLIKETLEIFLMIPPPVFEPYPFDMNGTVINEVFPTLVPSIASIMNQNRDRNRYDIHVIDLHTPLAVQDYTCDKCHPSHEANEIIANTMYESIMTVLKEKYFHPHHAETSLGFVLQKLGATTKQYLGF